jgi:hypothetical protein
VVMLSMTYEQLSFCRGQVCDLFGWVAAGPEIMIRLEIYQSAQYTVPSMFLRRKRRWT